MQTNPPPVICLGFNHRTSPLALREQLTCPLDKLRELAAVVSRTHENQEDSIIAELALVSTCNRWELYAYTDRPPADARSFLLKLVAEAHGLTVETLEASAYYLTGYKAMEHLLRVACGLESQVLGEAQVLGQVEDAFAQAEHLHSLGPVLRTVFQMAISAGKRARTKTGIGDHAASISSVALTKAQEMSGDLVQRNVLVVGLGVMARLALKALRARRVPNVGLVNRTLARAQEEAARLGYQARTWEALLDALVWADVVYVATGAQQPVISADLVEKAMAQRPDRPLVIVDAGVPRDVEPAASAVAHVHLFDIDDLKGTLDENLEARRRAIPDVERIIEQEMMCLSARLHELTVRPLIADLHQKAEAIRLRELERTLKYIGDVDPVTLSHIQHLSTSLVNKLLHEPTVKLRQKATQGDADPYIMTMRDLFGLEVRSQ